MTNAELERLQQFEDLVAAYTTIFAKGKTPNDFDKARAIAEACVETQTNVTIRFADDGLHWEPEPMQPARGRGASDAPSPRV